MQSYGSYMFPNGETLNYREKGSMFSLYMWWGTVSVTQLKKKLPPQFFLLGFLLSMFIFAIWCIHNLMKFLLSIYKPLIAFQSKTSLHAKWQILAPLTVRYWFICQWGSGGSGNNCSNNMGPGSPELWHDNVPISRLSVAYSIIAESMHQSETQLDLVHLMQKILRPLFVVTTPIFSFSSFKLALVLAVEWFHTMEQILKTFCVSTFLILHLLVI